MDERLAAARRARDALASDGIHFVPVRHHSPACARAAVYLIDAVSPAAVLIEGPRHYDSLLDDLQSEDTSPPVAVLTVRCEGRGRASSLYPMADFSPEWVALRRAGELGVSVGFIDLDEQDRPELDDEGRVLQSERYLAQSRTVADLAARLGCRDHDELWEHLFEVRDDAEPTALLDEVFVWSALARLDYEPEVLAGEGSLRREACMVETIRAWRDRVEGPLVVVTGAFHTLALVEELADLPGRPELPAHDAGSSPAAESWVVPITHADLDGLRGYSAGMPAPSFWQRVWDTGADRGQVATGFILDVVARANQAEADAPISFASAQEAVLQARRLAELRGHPWPSRTDVLDAITSCLVDEAVSPSLRDAVAHELAVRVPGSVASGSRTPPIVSEARETARSLRLVIDDAAPHSTTLDVARSDRARTRSRFLHLLGLLGVPFARRVSGPDLIAGVGAQFLTERWDYHWTPAVEAALAALMTRGATLTEAAATTLGALLEELEGARESAPVTDLLVRAALTGQDDRVEDLLRVLSSLIDQDPALGSVLATVTRLLNLHQAQSMLRLRRPEQVLPLLGGAVAQAAYLLPDLASVRRENEVEAVGQLVAVRRLLRDLDGVDGVDPAPLGEALRRLRHPDTAPAVRGAALAVGVAAGELSDSDLAHELRAGFTPGAEPGVAARMLTGMLHAAPELLVHSDELFAAADRALLDASPEVFLDVLPELRRAFTYLKPVETSTVAAKVAALGDVDAVALDARVAATEAELRTGMELERRLLDSLRDAGLSGWVAS